MTKQVTATFTVQLRAVWSVDKADPLQIRDDEGTLVATFVTEKDAISAVNDHNRTGRIRAKTREARKNKDA